MARNCITVVRLTPDENREIEKMAAGAGMSKSDYLRACLTLGIADSNDSDSNDSHSEIEKTLAAQSVAFEQLLQILQEVRRVPSFLEYRARCRVEGIDMRESETQLQQLHRLAQRYFLLYERWPVPADGPSFGAIPNDVDPQKWPTRAPGT